MTINNSNGNNDNDNVNDNYNCYNSLLYNDNNLFSYYQWSKL